MLKLMRAFAENVYVSLACGLTLLGTGLYEIVQGTAAEVGVHHGISIYALTIIFRALPELVHGAEAGGAARRMTHRRAGYCGL